MQDFKIVSDGDLRGFELPRNVGNQDAAVTVDDL
jgi:hypothetical protein